MKKTLINLLSLSDDELNDIMAEISIEDVRTIIQQALTGIIIDGHMNTLCRVFYKDTNNVVRVGYQANTNIEANFPAATDFIRNRLKTFEDYKKEHKLKKINQKQIRYKNV